MGIHLLISTLIPSIIFLPLAYFTFKVKKEEENILRNVIIGAAGGCVVGLIIFLPSLLLFSTSTMSSYIAVLDVDDKNKRTLAFWVLAINAIASEIIRWQSLSDKRYFDRNIFGSILHGLGWTLAEFSVRFLFFFDTDENKELLYQSILFLLLFVSSSCFAILLLRAAENTKYVMFAAFIKFFIELTIFGTFGYEIGLSKALTRLSAVIGLQIILVYLSFITRPTTNIN